MFRVVGKGFVNAKDLKTTDRLLFSDGRTAIINNIEIEQLPEPEITYNFEVEASLLTRRPENNDKTMVFEGSRNHLTTNDESEPKENAGGWGWRKVTRVFRNTTTEWVHVEVNDEKVTCTGEHPFYVLNATANTPIVRFEGRDDSKYAGQWVVAKNLKAGFEFLLSNGETATVQKITVEHLDEPQTTYNFEVEGAHTYCVGKNGVLVHNACPVDGIDYAVRTGNVKDSVITDSYDDALTIAKQKGGVSGNPVNSTPNSYGGNDMTFTRVARSGKPNNVLIAEHMTGHPQYNMSKHLNVYYGVDGKNWHIFFRR